jgi:DNA polymerase V
MNDKTSTETLRGGKRLNAGRKTGTGKFGEPTAVLRVPASQKSVIADFLAAYQRKQQLEDAIDISSLMLPAIHSQAIKLPLYTSKVSAGFPSPAEEHVEKRLDPSEFLIDQKDATFFVTIQGQSMIDAGLLPGDKAVINRSKIASVGDIILAVVNSEFTIKTLSRNAKTGAVKLLPANSTGAYSPIEITEYMQFEVWGVVTGSFRRY